MAGASISDILTAIQNGVVAVNNLGQQVKGSFNNIAGQFSAINAAWTNFVPVVTSTTGAPTTATVNGRYKQNGKTLIVETQITVVVLGPASGDVIVFLPVNAAAFFYVGSSISVSSGKSGYVFLDGAGNPSLVTARDATFTTYWGAGVTIVLTITYEAA